MCDVTRVVFFWFTESDSSAVVHQDISCLGICLLVADGLAMVG